MDIGFVMIFEEKKNEEAVTEPTQVHKIDTGV